MNTAQAVHEDSKQGAIKYIRSLLQDFLQHYPTWYLHFYSLRSIFQAEMQHLFILEMQSAF